MMGYENDHPTCRRVMRVPRRHGESSCALGGVQIKIKTVTEHTRGRFFH